VEPAVEATESAPVENAEPAVEEETGNDPLAVLDKTKEEDETPAWAKTRFAELTRQRHEAERKAAEREAQLLAMQQQQVQVAPQDNGPPRVEQFDNYDDFVAQLIEYNARQIVRSENQKMLQAQQQQVFQQLQEERQRKSQEQVKRMIETHDDFVETMQSLSNVNIPPHINEAVMDSEVGAEIAYVLAKNPSEAQRILSLPIFASIREIGKLEDRIISKKSMKAKEVRPKPTNTEPAGTGIPPKSNDSGFSRDYENAKKRPGDAYAWAEVFKHL
jgi:hypothetical protein